MKIPNPWHPIPRAVIYLLVGAILALLAVKAVARPVGCTIQRNADGTIARDAAQVRHFRRYNPCPSTGKTRGPCPGWVVDHIWPLCAGGCDVVENMAWQPVEESRRKDKLERRACLRPGESL